MKGPLVAALALVLVTISIPARAADTTVTFQVPVKLEKMDPQASQFFVGCTIFGDANYKVENSSPTVALQNGAHTGTLSIPVTVAAADLGKVKAWTCVLRLWGPGASSGINNPLFPWTKAAAGSVGTVSGQF